MPSVPRRCVQRCAAGERLLAATVGVVAWVWWLCAPAVLPVLVAIVLWIRSRPPKPLTTQASMQAHLDYLDARALTARSKDRGAYAGQHDDEGGGGEESADRHPIVTDSPG